MQAISRDILAGNAYRTLGLSASATQAAIDAAARRMRIWPDERRIPPTPWDVPWLGPVGRSRAEIERALSTLNEPGSRVEHRLLWYHAPPPKGEAEPAEMTSAGAPPARHDAVLRALHAAHVHDPDVGEVVRWWRVVEGVGGLAASAAYAAWVARVEEEGEFDKRASAAELRAAVDALPGAVAAALVPRAHAALDRDDPEAAADIAEVLRAAGDGGASAFRLLLDRLEDALARQCKEMDDGLRAKLRTDRNNPARFYADNMMACRAAAAFYNDTVSVALARFCDLAKGDADRLERARSRCAQVLALLAIGWEWSGEFGKAAGTQRVALGLAQGSAGEEGIRKDLERYEELMAQPPAPAASWVGVGTTSSGHWVGAGAGSSGRGRSVRPEAKSKTGGFVFVMLGITLVRVIMSQSDGGRSRPAVPYGTPYGVPSYPSGDRPPAVPVRRGDADLYRYLERDVRRDSQKVTDAIMKNVKATSEDPAAGFSLNPPLVPPPPPPTRSRAADPAAPRSTVDPARANDPFGDSSREQ